MSSSFHRIPGKGSMDRFTGSLCRKRKAEIIGFSDRVLIPEGKRIPQSAEGIRVLVCLFSVCKREKSLYGAQIVAVKRKILEKLLDMWYTEKGHTEKTGPKIKEGK